MTLVLILMGVGLLWWLLFGAKAEPLPAPTTDVRLAAATWGVIGFVVLVVVALVLGVVLLVTH